MAQESRPIVREVVRDLEQPVLWALLALGLVRIALSSVEACATLQCDDFGRFWYSTRGWLADGRSLYAPTPASYGDGGQFYANLNLPHAHLLFLPFIWLPLHVASVAWQITGVAAVAWSLRHVRRATGWRFTWTWLLVFVWWTPTHLQVVTGQVAWVMLPLVTLAWGAARAGAWGRAGVALGAAVALKPFLLPLLAWMAWRRAWRGVGAAIITAALSIGTGCALFGAHAYADWRAVADGVGWHAQPPNASIWGGLVRLLRGNAQYTPVADVGNQLAWFIALASVSIVVATYVACRRTNDVDRQWSVVLAASLLISPLGWLYYGAWLLPGLRGRWPGWASTACWLVPTPYLVLGQPSALATLTIGSSATWGLLLAFVHIARSARTPAQTPSPRRHEEMLHDGRRV
jgi:hypothetical protein